MIFKVPVLSHYHRYYLKENKYVPKEEASDAFHSSQMHTIPAMDMLDIAWSVELQDF